MMNKIRNILFFSSYKNKLLEYENKEVKLVDYIYKILGTFIVFLFLFYLVFTNWYYIIFLSITCSFFLINIVLINTIKIKYEYYILSQLTIYASQLSMLIAYNNVYSSIDKTKDYLGEPLRSDLILVQKSISAGKSIKDSFLNFNYKYNNKTITLFNQSLDLYDKYGSSEAGKVLKILSEDINNLKVKKDKFLRYKREWRIQYYVVVIMCLSMPVLLNFSMNQLYNDFMNSFGNIVMSIIIFINLLVIYKVEQIYSDLNISEGGYM